MKSILILLFLLSSLSGIGQWHDFFLDSNFTINPEWMGDSAKFKVNSALELQLDAPSKSDTSYLAVSSNIISNATWEFTVRFDFNPSSSNFSRVYLATVNSNLKEPIEAYYVMIGGSKDEVSLFYQVGEKHLKIIDGMDKRITGSNIYAKVEVSRDSIGNWQLMVKPSPGQPFFNEGTAHHDSLIYSSYFGVYCRYTSTRSNKFFFDSIEVKGRPYQDKTKPILGQYEIYTPKELKLFFSEPLDTNTVYVLNNYQLLNTKESPTQVLYNSTRNEINLLFNQSFPENAPFQLSIQHLTDTAGNKMDSTILELLYEAYQTAYYGDIIINEIMSDPAPSVGLPESEYVELYNRSNKTLNLSQWQLKDLGSSALLPEKLVLPHQYYLLIPAVEQVKFQSFKNIVPVEKFPSLNNSFDHLQLVDSTNKIIDSISYKNEWHLNDKSSGGWSLERIYNQFYCNPSFNWTSSEDIKGGSPSTVNAVHRISEGTGTDYIRNRASYSPEFELTFDLSEPIDPGSSNQLKLMLNGSVADLNSINISNLQLVLKTTTQIHPGSYHYAVTGLENCLGQKIILEDTLLIPSHHFEKLLINEVLFNPIVGGSDFIELYNNSENHYDLSWTSLAGFDLQQDTIIEKSQITDSSYLLGPQEYVVISSDTANVKLSYPYAFNRSFLQSKLPKLNNDQGNVGLINYEDSLFEIMQYHESMHFELLTEHDGVSLERISQRVAANSIENWHSAAESNGYGTPGYQNSQFSDLGITVERFELHLSRFSPNGDGIEDLLTLKYQLPLNGYVAQIEIYDLQGFLIKAIVNNYQLATTGALHWNGIDDEGFLTNRGIYFMLIKAYHASGKSEVKRLPFILEGN